MVLVYLGDEFFKDTEDDHGATNTEEERRGTSYVRRQATAKLKTKIKELEGEVAKLSSHISKVMHLSMETPTIPPSGHQGAYQGI